VKYSSKLGNISHVLYIFATCKQQKKKCCTILIGINYKSNKVTRKESKKEVVEETKVMKNKGPELFDTNA
jgi:hypothetical protein